MRIKFTFLIPLIILTMTGFPLAARGQIEGSYEIVDVYQIPNSIPDSSTLSLGIPNMLVQNDFNIFYNPSLLMQYGTAYGEIFNGAAWGGATFKVFGMKWGLFLARPYSGNSTKFLLNPIPSGSTSATQTKYTTVPFAPYTGISSTVTPALGTVLVPANHADLMVGMPLGDMVFGVKLTYADNSITGSVEPAANPASPTTDGKVSYDKYTADHHVSVGTVLPFEGSLKSVDVSVDYGLLFFRNSYLEKRADGAYAEQVVQSDGSFSLSALVRPIMNLGKNTLILPVTFGLVNANTKGSIKLDNTPGGTLETNLAAPIYRDTVMNGGILAALHTKPVEGLKVIYSLGAVGSWEKFEPVISGQKDTWISYAVRIPAAVSAEYELSKWMKARFGVSKVLAVFGSTDTHNEMYAGSTLVSTLDNSQGVARNAATELSVNAGLGFKAGKKVDIDLVLNTFQNTGFSWDAILMGASLKFHY